MRAEFFQLSENPKRKINIGKTRTPAMADFSHIGSDDKKPDGRIQSPEAQKRASAKDSQKQEAVCVRKRPGGKPHSRAANKGGGKGDCHVSSRAQLIVIRQKLDNFHIIVFFIVEEGGLAPFGKIDVVNFSYPRWAREIRLDTAFDSRVTVVTYFSTRLPCPENQATV